MRRKRWSELTHASRRPLSPPPWFRALSAATLLDLRRRPSTQVRGSKKLWVAAAFVNFVGPTFAYHSALPSCRRADMTGWEAWRGEESMRRMACTVVLGALLAVALSACGGDVPTSDAPAAAAPVSAGQVQAIAENMLAAYNSGTTSAFSRDLSLPAKLIVDEETFADFRYREPPGHGPVPGDHQRAGRARPPGRRPRQLPGAREIRASERRLAARHRLP